MKNCMELFGREHGPGWNKLTDPLMVVCKKYDISVDQVKEKFGGLRFYTAGRPEWLNDLVDIIEEYSFYVCEECGSHGELRSSGGWLATRCEKHQGNYTRVVG